MSEMESEQHGRRQGGWTSRNHENDGGNKNKRELNMT